MTDFIWELGVDYQAVQSLNGLSYLRAGLVSQGAMARASMQPNDQITFRIFDMTDSAFPDKVAAIQSFVIITGPADQGQTPGDPLSNLTPPFSSQPDEHTATSTAFPGTPLHSWSQANPPVTVTVPQGRFLLGFLAEVQGTDGKSRIFFQDPEMVVGAHG